MRIFFVFDHVEDVEVLLKLCSRAIQNTINKVLLVDINTLSMQALYKSYKLKAKVFFTHKISCINSVCIVYDWLQK